MGLVGHVSHCAQNSHLLKLLISLSSSQNRPNAVLFAGRHNMGTKRCAPCREPRRDTKGSHQRRLLGLAGLLEEERGVLPSFLRLE